MGRSGHFHRTVRVLLLPALVGLSGLGASAQLIDERKLSQENFLKRVGTIESFMERFNLEEDRNGNPVSNGNNPPKQESIRARTYSILSLFDIESANRATEQEKNNILAFIRQVNNEQTQTRLDFSDANWYAEVECNATFRKQPKKVTLILKNQPVSPAGSKWVIQSAYADFLRLTPPARQNPPLIPPNSHGTDFIGVPDLLTDAKNVTLFAAPGYEPDPFSMFLYAVYQQDLVLQETTRVRFHFLQIEGWVLQVKEYNREKPNAGWLIDGLTQADQATKKRYLKNLFTGSEKR